MYHNVDECLRRVYKLSSVCIEPMNNTAQICQWLETKGVSGSGSSLTQAEWHANAAMIIARIERTLNRYEIAAVRCQYSADLSGIVDLTAYIEQENKGVNLLICDAVLANLFTGLPKQVAIMDRYDLNKSTIWRQQQKIRRIVAALLDSAICKLELEFMDSGILEVA